MRLILAISTILFAVVLYANALSHPFMFDDHDAIVNHPHVANSDGWKKLWRHDYWGGRSPDHNLYRPITVLSYHLNARMTGMSAFWFRLFNVLLLGVLGSLIAYWFTQYAKHTLTMWLAVVPFLAHPVNCEAINHVVGRADVLAMIGVVGFAIAHRSALTKGRWSLLSICAGMGLVMLALGSKESGLIILPIAAGQAWLACNHQHHTKPTAERQHVHRMTVVLVGVPLVLYGIAHTSVSGFAVDYPVTTDDLTGNPLRGLAFGHRLPGVLSVGWFYFRQLFWPDTSFSHVPAALPTWHTASTWLGVIVLVGTLVMLIIALRYRHWLSLGLILAAGQYLLVGNLLLSIGVYAANRLAMPFVLAGTVVVAVLADRVVGFSRARVLASLLYAAVLMVMILSVVFGVNRRWSSERARMYADYMTDSNNPVRQYLYASALLSIGPVQPSSAMTEDQRRAIDLLKHVLQLRPDSLQARTQLAAALASIMDPNASHAAIGYYKQILERSPDRKDPYLQIARLSMLLGDFNLAEVYLGRARQRFPKSKSIQHFWAMLAANQGNYDAALRRYEALLQSHPHDQRVLQEYKQLRENAPE